MLGAAATASISAAGALANLHLDCAPLRAFVALSCGAVAAAVVIGERWAAAPDRPIRGAAAGAFAGAMAAIGSLA